MFSLFERLLKPTDSPEQAVPPPGFVAFFWHFARQAKGLFAALFAAGLVVALLDSTIPVFMGRIVTLITASPPDELFAKFWPHLLAMALVLLIARPIALTAQNLIANQAISANVSNRIRWQNHWYVVRQSWAFFQNDFAGRIANRVMQTGPAIRETLVALLTSVWYILVYGTSALILLASADPVLALPVALWFLGYLLMLRVLVPRMRDRSKAVSEGRSLLTGRIVDSYTNILTVKLFARSRGRRLCARRHRSPHQAVLPLAAAQHAVRLQPVLAQRADGDRHRRARALLVDAGEGRGRHRGDGAAARLADRQHRRLGRLADHLDLREYRRDPGGHDDHRPADNAHRPARCGHPQGDARRDQIRGCALRLRPRERRHRRPDLDRAAGRKDRPDRPFRRRQVDGGQSAAALLRPRRRPHPDRWGGHRHGHAGEPARANLGGHAGHLAAAPLDPRQHPLRPPAGDRGRGRDGGEARPCRRVHPRARGLEAAARLRGAGRRARREAVRRAAPAHRHRARDPQGRADPGPRRGHLRARQRGRGGDSIESRHADGRQDRDRHRASALDHRTHGPADRARARPYRRAGLA